MRTWEGLPPRQYLALCTKIRIMFQLFKNDPWITRGLIGINSSYECTEKSLAQRTRYWREGDPLIYVLISVLFLNFNVAPYFHLKTKTFYNFLILFLNNPGISCTLFMKKFLHGEIIPQNLLPRPSLPPEKIPLKTSLYFPITNTICNIVLGEVQGANRRRAI